MSHGKRDEAGIDFGVARHEAQSRALAFDPADDFYPGEPITGPVRQRSRVRTFAYIVMLGIAGWGMMQTSSVWRPWWDTGVATVLAELERRRATELASPMATATTPPSSTAPLEPLSMAKDVAEIAGTALNPPGLEPVAQPGTSETTTSPPAPNAAVDIVPQTTAPTPLPEPQIDPGDPYQKRAAAIGLHPQLSRALLSSFSDSDYRNAATAIRKALAEAADADKFIWPRLANAKRAVFQVHFVTGDRPDCRRYIVTVLMNGWTTTAPPMEKCGVTPPKRSAQADDATHRQCGDCLP